MFCNLSKERKNKEEDKGKEEEKENYKEDREGVDKDIRRGGRFKGNRGGE